MHRLKVKEWKRDIMKILIKENQEWLSSEHTLFVGLLLVILTKHSKN
jgi:hypothetical protein